MGALTLPTSGDIYLDANCIIYSVEHVEPYWSILAPCWQAAGPASFRVVTSDLTLLEAHVGPFKTNDTQLETAFRALLQRSSDVHLASITRSVLERAARLRADTGLKTPDAIHAATALESGCALFVTNDPALRRTPGLAVTVLRDLLAP